MLLDKSKPPGIVVLDDEADIRDFLRILFWEEGFSVVTVDTVDEALQQIPKGNVSLVISDIRLPGKTGIDLLKEVKSKWPDFPVILITGFADISPAEAKKLGAVEVVSKPINFEALLSLVKQNLGITSN